MTPSTQISGMEQTPSPTREKLLIKSNYQLIPVNIRDIVFIKALSDYVIIKTTTDKYITLSTMKDILASLPPNIFVRAHRSFIINMDKIRAVKGSTVELMENDLRFAIPIGRAYKKDFKVSLSAA